MSINRKKNLKYLFFRGAVCWVCSAFQFNFLLPFLDEIPFELQYHLGNFADFEDKMRNYFTQMEALRSLPHLEPGLLDTLAESPRAAVGGTHRKRRTLRKS